MGRPRFTVENIVRKLREAEVELSRGQTVEQVVKNFEYANRPIIVGARSIVELARSEKSVF